MVNTVSITFEPAYTYHELNLSVTRVVDIHGDIPKPRFEAIFVKGSYCLPFLRNKKEHLYHKTLFILLLLFLKLALKVTD